MARRSRSEIQELLAAQGPQRRAQRHHRDPWRRGRRGGEPVRPDLYEMYLRYAERHRVEGRGARPTDASDMGGFNEVDLPREGRRRLAPPQARGGPAPGPAGAGDRVPGPDPHLVGDGHRAARGRGGRRPHRGQGPQDRRVPLDRPGRPVGQHDRLGGAHHPPADRHRRRHAGREEPDPEPGQGHAGAAGPSAEGRAGPPGRRAVERRAAARSAAAAGRRRSAPTTTRRTGSPTTASA